LQANGKAAGSAAQQDAECGLLVTHTLRGEGFDASEDGTGRGTPLVAIAFNLRGREGGAQLEIDSSGIANIRAASGGSRRTMVAVGSREIAGALTSNYGKQPDSSDSSLGPNLAIAFDCKASGQSGFGVGEVASTMRAMGSANSHQNGGGHQAVLSGMQVRRLTPRECERLQGFPDDYTLITVRGKPAADGPRYKALGNSMAVPCMHWIGSRIQMVEKLTTQLESIL
jgi:DNA (cytosine-5)-methyltransferase 1